MEDPDVLRSMGLTDAQLRAFLRKVIRFYNRLTPEEQQVFAAGMAPVKQAAKQFPMTARQLEDFIKLREPPDAPTTILLWKVNPSG
jgi:hypothetical protein